MISENASSVSFRLSPTVLNNALRVCPWNCLSVSAFLAYVCSSVEQSMYILAGSVSVYVPVSLVVSFCLPVCRSVCRYLVVGIWLSVPAGCLSVRSPQSHSALSLSAPLFGCLLWSQKTTGVLLIVVLYGDLLPPIRHILKVLRVHAKSRLHFVMTVSRLWQSIAIFQVWQDFTVVNAWVWNLSKSHHLPHGYTIRPLEMKSLKIIQLTIVALSYNVGECCKQAVSKTFRCHPFHRKLFFATHTIVIGSVRYNS